MNYYNPDEFSLYDIACMLLVVGLFFLCVIGFGLLFRGLLYGIS